MGGDIIQHANTWNGWAFKTNNPLIVTEHTAIHEHLLNPYKTLSQRIYHKLIKKYETWSLESAECVTCVSQYVKKCVEKQFGYFDVKVILNGINTSVFYPFEPRNPTLNIDEKKTVILFVGNLTRLKGADLLSEIMYHLGDQYVLLAISGFKQNVTAAQKNIVNIGKLNQNSLVETYNLCDIFLSPTRLEGFGLSVAEAMACGKPIVATNCSSLPELVVDGKGGFLCGMNDVKDFAEKIRYLASEDNLRKKMGEYNRKRVEEKFELSRMVDEYIQLYKSL